MRHLPLLVLLFGSSTAFGATTGSVTVLLKNGGVGTFGPQDQVRVYADAEGDASDRNVGTPPFGNAFPGTQFGGNLGTLQAWDGTSGTYRFYATFPDANGVTTVELASGVQMVAGTTYYVSTRGVTTTDPGPGNGFTVANTAPEAMSVLSCSPNAANPTQNLSITWGLPSRAPGDFDRYLLQRSPASSTTWTTIGTYTQFGPNAFTDTNLTRDTTWRYRLVHRDRYDAETTGVAFTCSTSNGDLDGDGYIAKAYGGPDCNDAAVSIYPGATEIAGDGIDQDCNGADLAMPADQDFDGLVDAADNCVSVPNADQANNDGDGPGDACDKDDDNDGVGDELDLCPFSADADQADLDIDGEGDACDLDDDGDLVDDDIDVCPRVSDADQYDLDHDLLGDACDGDDDGDGISDDVDVCPSDVDPDQLDADGDGVGDVCDPFTDTDADLVVDSEDNCPLDANDEQLDTDADGAGDTCDVDDDNDGVEDDLDLCSVNADPFQEDADSDGLGDACDEDDDDDGVLDEDDNCVFDANTSQSDLDEDAAGDACDTDDDADGVDDATDNCAVVANADQFDNDDDGAGDDCDADDDDDAIADDAPDNCQFLANADQSDLDADAQGDVCDPDDDGDGVYDIADNCPVDANEDQLDTDADALGDVCDPDDDDDDVLDEVDICALDADPTQADADCDGAGDACDDDIDGDAYVNDMDACPDEAAYTVDLDEDGCPDAACDLDAWIASRSTAEIATQMVRSMRTKAQQACSDTSGRASHLEALSNHTLAQRGKKVAPDTADQLIEAIDWIETAWACERSGIDCDLLDVCE